MKKPQLKEREDFIFAETLSELPLNPRSEEKISHDLFGMDPEKYVDAYEKQLGILPPSGPAPKIKYKNIMLSPGVDDDDSKLLNDLYNDIELYHIVNRTSYWTPRGELKLFIEYTENLDVKAERDRVKQLEKVKQQELLELEKQQESKETTNE